VFEWLRSKEVARIEAFQSRQTEAASGAADAVERSDAAARRQAAAARANERATIALIVATVSATICHRLEHRHLGPVTPDHAEQLNRHNS
jgi:hypothetical protein